MRITKYVISAALAMGLLLPAVQSFAGPKTTTIRPIEEFVERQGTFCFDGKEGAYVDEIVDGNFVGDCPTGAPPLLLVPPIANFIGQNDPANERSASVDYAGLADYWAGWAGGAFGTTTAGQVIERPLADGRALVEVLLRTGNALTWVAAWVEGKPDFNGELLFGERAPEVLASEEAALGNSFLQVKFINTAPGDPLPDLIQLFFFPDDDPGQEVLYYGFRNRAKGPLRALFGVPDGTPGLTTGVQTGLLGNPQCGLDSPSAVADCFPAERIDLRVIGQ